MEPSYFSPVKIVISSVIFLTGLAAQGQTIITNFAGLNYNDIYSLGFPGTPPDTMGAAGTNQFVEFINGGFAIYSKAGVQQSSLSDRNFWANAGIAPTALTNGLFDPRIQYDASCGRFFATELTGENTGNHILLARSDSSNPSGTWHAVSFTASAGAFADFDTLGVDSQAIYMAVNIFTDGSQNGFFNNAVSLFSVPKSDIIAPTPTIANLTSFANLDANTYGFALQGVNNPDTGSGHGVIMAIDNTLLNQFECTTVNGSGAAGATLSSPTVIHTAYDGYPSPATQPGGNTLDSGDDRFSGAVRQIGGYIFIANCISNTVSPGIKNAVHWMVVNETNNTVTSEGLISDPNYDFIYPSIAANHSGNVLLGFNRIGNTAPAGDTSTCAALGTMVNGLVTMGAPFVLQPGTVANYSISFDSAPYRWGDYSATMFDPTDENLVWTIQEIPVAANVWGTEISLISLASNRPTLNISYNGGTVAIAWPLSSDPAYILQSNTNLAATAWNSVRVAPQVIINQRVVTVPVTNSALYFRLKK